MPDTSPRAVGHAELASPDPPESAGWIASVAEEDVPFDVAVILAVTACEAFWVATVKVVLSLPAGTVMVAGTEAEALLHLMEHVTPPEGAGPERVTVAVLGLPPLTASGLSIKDLIPKGVRVSGIPIFAVPSVTVIVLVDLLATDLVAIAKETEVAPASTLTLLGTDAELVLDLMPMAVPPSGAAPLSRMVPMDELPPMTVDGLRVSAAREGGLTLRLAVALKVPDLPVSVTVVGAATGEVVALNVIDLEPAGTVTLSGTVAARLLLVTLTANPPEGAALLIEMVPVEPDPPMTELGLSLMDERV